MPSAHSYAACHETNKLDRNAKNMIIKFFVPPVCLLSGWGPNIQVAFRAAGCSVLCPKEPEIRNLSFYNKFHFLLTSTFQQQWPRLPQLP